MESGLDRAWAEIDLDCIAHNVREIKRITGKRVEVMGIVKADAYGHGVMETVRTLLSNGITRLGVSMLDEAIQMRQNGIGVPILVLNYTDPRRADEIISNDITQTVFSHDLAQALSQSAVRLSRKVRIHVKIDTGMTRVGFMPGYSAVKNIVEISKLPNIIIEGLFTHFASADEKDKRYTEMQFERFMSIWNELGRIGVHIPLKHAANSAATIDLPHTHLDMVRTGVILYGLYPSCHVDKSRIQLKPAMTLKANITLVKDVEPGTAISYGCRFTTRRQSRIATLPVGYADGYTRLLGNKGIVLVNGQRAPIVGSICMDQCMADVTDIEGDVKTGDEAVIFGRQGDAAIPVEEVASLIGTINYEVVCVIGKRIPRVYLRGGRIADVLNYLVG